MIRLFKLPRETTTLKWYHKIFPYRIRHFSLEQIRERMFDEWEEEGHGDFEDWVYTWLSNEENKSVPYVIYFDVPQYVVNTDIYLVPIRSLESIKLNFIIGDEYE